MYPIPELIALARTHLHPGEAERWISCLSVDSFLLSTAEGETVGRFGGDPLLPAEVDWPIWEGHGPLAFVVAIDCAAMAERLTEYAWPPDGTLLFFYFDGQAGNGGSWVDPGFAAANPGSRVLYVPADAVTAPRPAPEPLAPFPVTPVTAVPAAVPPARTDADVSDLGYDGAYEHPRLTALDEAVGRLKVGAFGVGHQIGGAARYIQHDVHFSAAMDSLERRWPEPDEDEDADWDPETDPMCDPEVQREAGRWKLLLQVGSDWDQNLMWGDAGALYWLIKPEDLTGLRFDRIHFTQESH